MQFMRDAQQAMGFLISQTSYIEPQVVEVQYPDIQYPALIPVDTSANEWAKSVTFFSTDKSGKAAWLHGRAKDIAIVSTSRDKHESGIEMANIGYDYTLEELGTQMLIPGQNLSADRAIAARRAYEEFVDDIAFRGDPVKGLDGFISYPGVPIVMAAATGNNHSMSWADKNEDQMLVDINDALVGQYIDTKTVELADTILLPLAAMAILATRRLPNTTMTVLQFLSVNNVYTFQTGRPLAIRQVRGLETAGTGGSGRMVVYRRDPQVLKMHIPMTHRFLPVWQSGPMEFLVPGIFRLGGVEIRRPGAVRYVDGITTQPYE